MKILRKTSKQMAAIAMSGIICLMGALECTMPLKVYAAEAGEDTVIEQDTVSSDVTFNTENGITTVSFSADTGVEAGTDSETGVASVTITAAGTYTFNGNAVNTTIAVSKNLSGVALILDGVTIDDSELYSKSREDKAVIQIGSGSSADIILSGTNTLKGNENYIKEAEAVIKAKEASVTFKGSGSLTIENSIDDAIKAKDGTINIESGTITLKNISGDGLKAKREDSESGGNINISGGTLNITDEIYGDGIQGENVSISGGTVNIATVYNYAANGYYTSGSSSSTLNTLTEDERSGLKTERINVDTGSHAAIKAGTKAATYYYLDGTESSTSSASGGLTISGGTINLDTTGAGLKAGTVSSAGYTKCSSGVYIIGAPDDALHSNNSLSITGGTITINASDDAVTASKDITISGSDTVLDIETCYEGLEGENIVIGSSGSSSGPCVTIKSNDDGINAAAKTNVTYTYDSADDEDCYYTKTTTKGNGNSCVIYSGEVNIYIDSENTKSVSLRKDGSTCAGTSISYKANGDGIDCNGSLDIEGGRVYVFGSTENDNSPIDTDNGFTLGSNAELLETGSSGMGNEALPASGSAVYVTYGGSGGMGGSGAPGGMVWPGGMTGSGGAGDPDGAGGFGGMDVGEGMPGSGGASVTAGSTLTILSENSTLFTQRLPYAASFILYASNKLTSGSTYTLEAGSIITTVTATSAGGGSVIPMPTPVVTPTPTVTPTPAVTPEPAETIVISPSSVTIEVGKTASLTVTGYKTGEEVVWSSSDESIVTVNNGLVTGVSSGTAVITASVGSASATSVVSVDEPAVDPDIIIKVGKKTKLKADMRVKKVKVSENGIVKTAKSGKKVIVTGKKTGIVTVTAYNKRGEEIGSWVVQVE